MSFEPDRRYMTRSQTAAAEIDVGLRRYMLGVYNYMALGVAFTGVVALALATNPQLMQAIAQSQFKWVLFFGILGLGFFAPRLILTSGSQTVAQGAFWLYCGLWGALLAPMFYIYTQASIAEVFFITAAMFAGTSLYGYTTKKDLTGIGQFLAMATIGILVALLVNIFLVQSAGFHLLLSIVVVLVFAGLTAYYTQMIKESYIEGEHDDTAARKAIFGAFLLYGAFITLFVWLLSIFGNRN